jgi:hypothetical protein
MGTVEVRSVTTDPDVDHQGSEQSVILTGLDPGELIVVKGLDRLQADAKVSVRMQAPTTREQQDENFPTTHPSTSRASRGQHGMHRHHNPESRPSGASTEEVNP